MLGAIIGDIAGSRFEWDRIKSKEFELLAPECNPTDDSLMTIAIANAILECDGVYRNLSEKTVIWMQWVGRKYPNAGYGGRFKGWLEEDKPKPYNSLGNGSAMRVSPVIYAADSLEEVRELSYKVTAVTHNHPEGIKGAEATAMAGFMARTGCEIDEIRDYIDAEYYPMDFTLDEIRPEYGFDETSPQTVPQALMSFFESKSYEDTLRNAISLGGDSDTLAAIAGAVAAPYYGIPYSIRAKAYAFMDMFMIRTVERFDERFRR